MVTVLALNILEACCLSETDEKFVLTAVDFKTGRKNTGNLNRKIGTVIYCDRGKKALILLR